MGYAIRTSFKLLRETASRGAVKGRHFLPSSVTFSGTDLARRSLSHPFGAGTDLALPFPTPSRPP